MCWTQQDFDLLFGQMHVWFTIDCDFVCFQHFGAVSFCVG